MSKIKLFFKNTKNWFLKLSPKAKLIIIAVTLLILWFGATIILGASKKQAQYQTAQVQKGSIIATVNESGNVASNSQAGVGSPTTGIIEEVYVKDGDSVTAGQNLFKVKSIATPQEQASAYANLLTAQNNLSSAQSKTNSLQAALFKANQAFINDKGIPNPTDLQKTDPVYIEENATWLQAQADYVNQQGVVSQAQAALNDASLSYQATQDSVVPAPLAGTIANLALQVGDQVTASSGNLSSNLSSNSTSSSNPVLSIGDFSKPYIKVQASEVDITSIKPGQKATVTLSAFADKTFVGNVDQVDTAGTISSGVVTYNVYISFLSAPSDIKPGMSASVTIQTARNDNVLSVPSTAVQTTSGSPTVRILKNGQVTTVDVTTGIASDTDTEITSGLNEGDTVVTGIVSQASTSTGTTSPFGRSLGGFGGGGGVIRTGGGGARGGN